MPRSALSPPSQTSSATSSISGAAQARSCCTDSTRAPYANNLPKLTLARTTYAKKRAASRRALLCSRRRRDEQPHKAGSATCGSNGANSQQMIPPAQLMRERGTVQLCNLHAGPASRRAALPDQPARGRRLAPTPRGAFTWGFFGWESPRDASRPKKAHWSCACHMLSAHTHTRRRLRHDANRRRSRG